MKEQPTKEYSEEGVIALALEILEQRIFKSDDVLNDRDLVKNYLTLKIGQLEHEIFGAIFLDLKFRVIASEIIFRGTLAHSEVYPREIIKLGLKYNASAMIIYHNHPSGVSQPSPDDIQLTKRLGDALSIVDIRIIDHIIVAGTNTLSFSEAGKLPTFSLKV
jgi:DNA repair protein RadC